jgi:hypothetical protein
MRALDFGPLTVLQQKYGKIRNLEDMPSSSTTNPSIIFKRMASKKTLVTYPIKKALALMARRDPLPPIYNKVADVTTILPETVGRGRLILKTENTEELMRETQDDDG